jgi:hypothetical protein
MRPDRHRGIARQPYRAPHHPGVSAVKPARHVRRRDARHHLVVSADAERAERLSHVAIQIDGWHAQSWFYGVLPGSARFHKVQFREVRVLGAFGQ